MLLNTFYVRFLKRLSFLLVCYSFIRIGFYFFHLNLYRQFHQEDILESFFLGLRFDLAAICLLNFPILLLALIPSWNRFFLAFERSLYIFINLIAFGLSFIDYELFLFMGKRMGLEIFTTTGGDIIDQLPQMVVYYWYFPILAFGLAAVLYLLDQKYIRLATKKVNVPVHIGLGVLLLGLAFVGIRGGLQHKSINVQSAFSQGKNELGHLVLNTPYHFLRTIKTTPPQKLAYFKSEIEALNIIMNQRDLRTQKKDPVMKNVVLIIMESFSLEYFEKGYMPFLSELAKKSLSFPYHLANGKKSIEALPSLLCALPGLIDDPISKSMFSGNNFVCFPSILKEAGYSTVFFHGGARGTMGFDAYTMSHGFDRYYSRDDHKNTQDFDGNWGIFDRPFFQFFASELGQIKEPFLAGIFSLSSHQPYAIPEAEFGKYPKGNLEIHESIGYSDDSLREFFQTVETAPWYRNTLFIITADHTQKFETKKYQNQIGRYRVPLLIFEPGREWSVPTEKVTQHSDIPRTIIDELGLPGDELPATSVSVFSSDKGHALIYADGRDYLLVSKDEVLKLPKDGEQQSYVYDWETGEMSESVANENPLLKAYLQYFQNGLISNNLSIYR